MATLPQLQELSGPQCVLLAVQYATESNVAALQAVTALREDELPLELLLRILLTHLPEEMDPTSYNEFLAQLGTGSRTPGDSPSTALHLPATILDLSNSRAQKKRNKLDLLPVVHSLYTVETELDLLSHFLIHRAHRIDTQTGLLDLVPRLVVPFLENSEYLRAWFIATVLPLLRMSYEYYPRSVTSSLDEFAQLGGRRAIDYELFHVQNAAAAGARHIARDLKAVVAPWMCGAGQRKRRCLVGIEQRTLESPEKSSEPDDWDSLFQWLLNTSKKHLGLVTTAFNEWDGPEDMDLGGYDEGRDYVDDEQQRQLEVKYAQTILACLYLVDKSDTETLRTTHLLLRRICDLLNYDRPQDLTIGTELLPIYNLKTLFLQDLTTSSLREERLLDPDNAITKPTQDAVRVLELVIFSSYLLSTLQYPMSIQEVAKMSLQDNHAEQLVLLEKILHNLTRGSTNDSNQWPVIRSKLLWLWSWGSESHDGDRFAQGILGMIERKKMEAEILKALLESAHFPLAIQIYVQPGFGEQLLLPSDVEQVVLASAMRHYDNASNGNRTRGGMKRATDIIAAFSPHFSTSSRFQRMHALLAATHALSYYSLILQHGTPFQPVNIRVGRNPLTLIRKLLSQNPGSYTKLDDLISIGQNLVIAMPATILDDEQQASPLDAQTDERKKAETKRRVTGMAIEAALEEDDFETAYSFVVNRLTPNTPTPTPPTLSQTFSFGSTEAEDQEEDAEDTAWRAALRAGRYNSPHVSTRPQSGNVARADLRRLEQRMELLSQALLLAPPEHLPEILEVWQECEAQMTDLLAQEDEAEKRFNDAADSKIPGAFNFDMTNAQPRHEFSRAADEESSMGLFDVARGAASAFSKSAFPLRSSAQAASRPDSKQTTIGSSRVSMDLSESGSMKGHDDRVRKRDIVASAATGALATGSGALATGLGWVLGAKPVTEREQD